MTQSQKAGGHKANLKNPHTSDESKEHSKRVLENEHSDVDDAEYSDDTQSRKSSVDTGEKTPARVAGGLKATLKNPRVSDEAKESAKERLESMGEDV